MTRIDILNLINKIESDFPVNTWCLNDKKIWPFLRLKLAFLLINHFDDLQNPIIGRATTKSHKNVLPKFFRLAYLKIRKTFILFWGELKLIKSLSYLDYLFLEAPSHRVDFNNKNINRFFEPLLIEFEGNYKKHRLVNYSDSFIQKMDKKNTRKSWILSHYFQFFFLKRCYENVNYFDDSFLLQLNHYDEFEKKITLFFDQNSIENHFFNHKNIVKYFKYINGKIKVCKFLLEKTRPSLIFELCYYNENVLCFNIAASELDIKSIEIQHGPHSEIHPAYAKWDSIDGKGYECLPDFFWAWDRLSLKPLKTWLRKTNKHHGFIGGHPWIAYRNKYLQKSISSKPNVLFSLQPIGQILEDHIVQLIKKTYSDFNWWLRAHPRQLERANDIKSFLHEKRIDEIVRFWDVSITPLPDVLINTDIHITKFSGVTLEANYFNIKTILVDPIGKETYAELIKTGDAFYVEDTNISSMLNLMRQIIENGRTEIVKDYATRSYTSLLKELEKDFT